MVSNSRTGERTVSSLVQQRGFAFLLRLFILVLAQQSVPLLRGVGDASAVLKASGLAGFLLAPQPALAQAVPAATNALGSTPSSQKVKLFWDPVRNANPAITKWQYQQKTGSNAYGAWTDIPNSADGERNSIRHEITGLTNNTVYKFKVRAVNSAGNGAVSNEATATPTATKTITLSTDQTNNRITEGDTARKDIVVTATLSEDAPAGGLDVSFSTWPGSGSYQGNNVGGPTSCTNPRPATADVCAPDPVGAVTIAAGERTATRTIGILPDTRDEPDEYFTVYTTAADWAADTILITIVDNDGPATAPVLTGATSNVPAYAGGIKLTWTHSGKLLPSGVNFYHWQPASRLKGSSNWELGARAGDFSGGTGLRTARLSVSRDFPEGAVVEVRIRALGSRMGSEEGGPWSNIRTVTISDDDSGLPALTFTNTPLSVAEDGTATYTVALAYAYAGTLRISSSATSKATVSPDTLNFTTSNYNTGQTVRVTGVAGGSATINHAFRLTGASVDAIPDAGTVAVTVVSPAAPAATSVLGSNPGSQKVKLFWDRVRNANPAITKWQYQQKTGSAAYGAWTDIPNSADGQRNSIGYEITGLNNGTIYKFKVRAVNSAGTGAVSNETTATPTGTKTITLSTDQTNNRITEGDTARKDIVVTATLSEDAPAGGVSLTINSFPGSGSFRGNDNGGSDNCTNPRPATADICSPSRGSITIAAGERTGTRTVGILPDTRDEPDEYFLMVTQPAGWAGDSILITIVDNDDPPTPGLTISESRLTVTEGSTGTYTVKLNTDPGGTVTVTPTSADPDAASVSPASLQFTSSNYSAAKTVTITGEEDVDKTNERVMVSHGVRGYGAVTSADSVTVSVADNDVTAAPAAPSIFGAIGRDGKVKLGWDRVVDATIVKWQYQQKTGTGDYGDWMDIPDSGAGTHYHVVENLSNGTAYAFKIRAVNGAGPGTASYESTATPTTTKTITLTSDQSNNRITEGDTGRTDITITATLSEAAPSGGLAIIFSYQRGTAQGNNNGSKGTGAGSSCAAPRPATADICFPVSTTVTIPAGSTTGTLKVGILGDTRDEGDETFSMSTHTQTEGIGWGKDVILITIVDDDAPAAPAAPTGLSAAPGNGQVTLSWTKPAGTITGYKLRYGKTDARGSATWSAISGSDATTESYRVTGLENNAEYSFKVRAVNGSTDGIATDWVPARPVAPGVTISKSRLAVNEGGSGEYTVRLNSKPSANVIVSVGGAAGEVTVTGSPLTFTSGDYGTPQTVTVNAGPDEDTTEDTATLTHTSSSSDTGYGASLNIDSVAVTVTDTTPTLQLLTNPPAVSEGADITLTVTSDKELTGDLTVRLRLADRDSSGFTAADIAGTIGPRNFTASFGNSASTTGTVTISTSTDNVVEGPETYRITLEDGTGYAPGADKEADGTLNDGTAGVIITPTTLSLEEGGSPGSYTVVLSTDPSATVTLTPSSDDTDAATVSAALNFDSTNWSTEQTVTVTPVADLDATDETVTVSHAISGYSGVSNSDVANVSVSVEDGTVPAGVTITPTKLPVNEGGSGEYTIKLDTAPSANVIVRVGGAAGEVTVTGSPLTFTPTDYSTVQTVTVNAGADEDTTEDTATLTHTSSSTDTNYGTSLNIDEVAVTVTDTTPTLQLLTDPVAVSEGTAISLMVTSDKALTGDLTVNLTLADRDSSGFTAADIAGTIGPRDFTASFGSSGSTTGTVTIPTSTDEDVEGAETYRITLNDGTGYAPGEDKEADGTLNDGTAGVIITPTMLSLEEGGSAGSYTVVLSTDPSATVMVTPSSDDTDAATVSAALSFDSTNWSTEQTVTVTPVDDLDASDETVTVSNAISGSGAYSSVTAASVSVSVEDDETPSAGVTIKPTQLSLSEGGSAGSYTVVLNTDPSATVMVTPSSDDTDAATVSAALSFDSTNWSTAQTVTVTPVDDLDASDETVTVSNAISGSGAYGSVTAASVSVSVEDDETPSAGVTIKPTQLSLSEGGSAGSYTVVLNTDPSAPVTVTPRSSDAGAVRVSAALSFDSTNWSTEQTVTVTPVDDLDASDETVTVSNAISGSGAYSSVTAASVRVRVDDDETSTPPTTAGVTVTPTRLSLTEGGRTGSYRVVLDSNPSTAVTVTPRSSDAGAAVVSAALTFTSSNWSTAQVVTVTPVADPDASDETVTVSNAVRGSGAYGSVTAASVRVRVDDDETPGVTVTPTQLSLTEGGNAKTYTVVLDTDPQATVTVTPISNDAGAASVSAALTFTSSNWSTARTVMVTPVNDDDANNETVTVSHGISGYSGVSRVDSVTVRVDDDDTAGVTVSTTRLSLTEGGSAGSYTVVLDSDPLATVTVTPASDDAGAAMVSGGPLTFTSSNWSTEQIVMVTPVDDDDANDETVMVSHAISGYGGVSNSDVANVTVAVEDDETAGVTITPTELSLTEGGTATTYMVVLDSNPLATVTLTPSSGDAGAAMVSAALSFDSSNWSTAQPVTVTAVNDGDINDEIVTVGHAITGYRGVSSSDVANVTVRVAEPGVTVTPTTLPLEEGGNPGTYMVVLDAMPSGNVTVTPSPTGADEAAARVSAALTFTTANWDTAQSVTVTPVDDADANDETVMVGHAIIGYPRVSDSDVDEVTVTVADDDTAGVTVTPTSLSLTEGGSTGTYTVKLNTMPSGNVTVTPGSGDTGAVMVSAALTFTPSNWDTARMVTVTPVGDDDADNETVTVTHAISGYGTVRTADSVMVMVTDDETEDRPQVEARKEELVGLSRATLGMATDMIGARVGGDLSGSSAGAGAIGEQALGLMENLLWSSHGSELSGNLSLEQLGEQLWNQSFHISQSDSERAIGEQRGRWSLWGAGDLRSFKGNDASDAEEHSYSGSIKAGWLGVDYQLSNSWLAGLAVSFSSAESDYTYRSGEDGTGAGETKTQLTTFHPYGSVQLTERLKLWGTAGIGFGDLRHQDNDADEDDNSEDEGELNVYLAAIGFAQKLSSLAAWNVFSLAGDLAFVQSSTEWQDNALEGQSVSITRARLGVNGSFPLSQTTTGYMNLRGRLDGGDLQMGAAEMVLGLRYSTGRFSAILQGRQTSALDGTYSESGLLGELRFSSQEDGTGLALQLQPSYGGYGEVGSQQASLWNDQQLNDLTGWSGNGQPGGDMALKSTMGYGFLLSDSNVLLTPFAEVAFTQGSRHQIGLGLSMEGSSWQVKLSGSREESSSTAPTGTVKVMFSKQL